MKIAPLFVAVAVAASISIGTATPAHALSDQQRKFVADVIQRGVNGDSMINGETQQTLGDAVCADLHKGNGAANEVIGVANDVTSLRGSMRKPRSWSIGRSPTCAPTR